MGWTGIEAGGDRGGGGGGQSGDRPEADRSEGGEGGGGLRSGAREVEARGGLRVGVGDEERGHGEVEFIGKAAGQELAEDPGAAFYQDTHHTSFGQIGKDEIEGERVAGVDEYGAIPQPRPGAADRGGGAVHQAERAGGEETGLRVQVAGGGEGDPGRMGGQAAGGAAGAAARVPDQQPRVVLPDRLRADQDGVAARPDLVHAVQVGGAGQDQAPRARVVQVAVGRGGAGQQHVRTRGQANPPLGGVTPA